MKTQETENKHLSSGKDETAEMVGLTTKTAGIGATAGAGVAAIIGGPVVMAGLIGGGLACLGAGIWKAIKD